MDAPIRIDGTQAQALHDTAGSRRLEHAAAADLPPHALMARAGLAVARMAMAVAPASRRVGIVVGPGNNGGDGLVAARHLRQQGLAVTVLLTSDAFKPDSDADWAWLQAREAGLSFATDPADLAALDTQDLLIDALLGLGADRPPTGRLLAAVEQAQGHPGPRLAVDLPTGLDGDTGNAWDHPVGAVRADHTLSLLSLKPGLFTGHGRDVAGCVWLDRLGVPPADPTAWLGGADAFVALMPPALHASHKGTRGDVAVVGGATGMTGAAVLAAEAALAGGAGRVYLATLGTTMAAHSASLMTRAPDDLDWSTLSVVCGCGGGQAIQAWLPDILARAARLVLDADALNALVSGDAARVRARGPHLPTVLTPHPLEAARLLQCDTKQIQADRLRAARELARHFGAVVLLKGSGSVIAAPDGACWVNPTGDARLASAGTGDVLAGLCGALLARALSPFDAARLAAYRHGAAASNLPSKVDVLPAHRLVQRLAELPWARPA